FAPSLERDWLDPYLIPGLAGVADALQEAVKAGRHIVVFGDFDLDGVSATAVLTYGLRALGAQATPFVPLRIEEGYGLTEAAIGRLLELKPDFVVTVDCGIASKHEVALIREAGVEVAVTDHHEPVDLVPEEVPVADPKLDAACPSTALAGVGVALKLVQVLGGRFGKPHLWRDYTDLAALGTVADLMPMLSENRALVADGIARMNQAPRGCIAALLGISGVQGTALDAINLSFSLIPRLNAAGRMGDARLALDLLLSDDFAEAQALAAELEEINDRRRVIEAELSEAAKEQAVLHYQGQRVLVVSGEGWHEGVKGIVASRLVNTYAVPTLLFTIDGDVARGSGRSVGQVNLFKAVESLSDMLVRFGGHEAAVGVTVPTARLTEFAERLSAYMDGLPAESFRSHTEIDACVALDELTLKNVVQLEKLAPFGQENPTPCFLALNVTLTNCKAVGADKSHLACTLSDGKHSLASIKFHCSDIEAIMRYDTVVNAAFRLQIDEWNGRKTVKAVIESFTPPQACAALEACLDPLDLDFMEDLYTAGGSRPDASRQKAEQAEEARFAVRKKNRAFWEGQAKADPAALQAQIIAALIGDRQLHDSQAEALDCLARGQSVLAVMPTGRGKSLIFHVHAACQALLRGTTSLFVYPLRALIADQAFHIGEALEGFGIATAVLTGGMGPQKRSEAFASIAEGACDIVLATPEFLDWHADALCDAADIGFVVVDEAHHIGLAKAGQRPAYLRLGKAVARLGSPTVLASTATADREVADAIKATLGIERCVCDETVRENLAVDDQRNLKDRASYLANLVAGGEKTVVYVNSREQSVALARMLRKLVPQMASLIGFYNAGLTRAERRHVEDLFRTDALCVLVSTSAFGEGVNIP
ncbi:MAG: single-stranded-DNA-specific exonuclease RecJ, partial [Coriobacteriaceae bacterium]|nr:single-stranded-DNA-specific exonuclease RecJ [Coriobacteriaceae bacterium]